jgi:hypothetical protein
LKSGNRTLQADSFVRAGNNCERAVTIHEQWRGGLRQRTRTLMVARGVLTTLSRSAIFPACGAGSGANERVGSVAGATPSERASWLNGADVDEWTH